MVVGADEVKAAEGGLRIAADGAAGSYFVESFIAREPPSAANWASWGSATVLVRLMPPAPRARSSYGYAACAMLEVCSLPSPRATGACAKANPSFADLHVHLGRDREGRPVKVTASARLTLENIFPAAERKGLHLVGLVDAVVPACLGHLGELTARGELRAVPGGGYVRDAGTGRARPVVLLVGAEMEAEGCHYLAYFATVEELADFAAVLHPTLKNPSLSTQATDLSPARLARLVHGRGGLFLLAHAFTPHKGYYGRHRSLEETFAGGEIDGVELGLSADTAMADGLAELAPHPYLSNSDAHSLENLAREFTAFSLAAPSFAEVCLGLRGEGGRTILANVGLDPRLGKYHRTACGMCGFVAAAPPPVWECPTCGGKKVTVGVVDRLAALSSGPGGRGGDRPRPPYRRQVPLGFIPGLGAAGRDRLVGVFGSELAALHLAAEDELASVVGRRVAALILAARRGDLELAAGGGGRYGKVLQK